MSSTNPDGRKAAIENMCKQCVYDPAAEGTWREQVQDCGCPNCPLYDFRPLPVKAEKLSKERRKQ